MIKNVLVSHRLKENGIRENHRGYPKHGNIRVFGADTETCKGRLYSFQVASQGDEVLRYTTPERAFAEFMGWIEPRILDKGVNIVFFHNLKFDLTVLFAPDQEAIYNQYNDIYLERDGYIIRMLYGRVNFVRVWKDLGGYLCPTCGEIPKDGVCRLAAQTLCGNPKHGEPTPVRRNLGTLVRWIDSAAFCPPGSKSLAAALKIYGVSYKKMKQPQGLGKRILKDAYFEEYALNDSRAEEALGLKILDLHRDYDISPCVSLPQLSARILRHHFFRPGETFPFPPEACRLASELSYHAGKNGFYVKRGIYENLIEYDINSAFPKAMKEMPQMVKGSYKKVKKYDPKHLGIYLVKGTIAPEMKYPLVFDAAFRPCRRKVSEEWVTGYEWKRIVKDPHYKLKLLEGWIWKHKRYPHSPLGEFVDRFWHLKSTAPKGPKRDTYKNILNSLYGKFAACVEKKPTVDTAHGLIQIHDSEKGTGAASVFVAGSLYHPFIATQITGYVRGALYDLEKKGLALHAATDSIKSFRDLATSEDLGGIKKEVEGRCYLFRNKLYLHFAKDTSLCKHDLVKGWLPVFGEDLQILGEVGQALKTGVCYDAGEDRYLGKLIEPDGQHLCKYGLHGFKGSAFVLYRWRHELLERGHFDYEYDHMVSLREGTIRGETICDMTKRQEHLCLIPDCTYTLETPLVKSPL